MQPLTLNYFQFSVLTVNLLNEKNFGKIKPILQSLMPIP